MKHFPDFTAVAVPEKDGAPWWPVFRQLRDAREKLGLKPRHLTTLAALLSYLRAGDTEMIVFASNRGVLNRLNGASERTLQRHVLDLEAAGLLRRHDSPNGKRYRLRGRAEDSLAFGLVLSPLLERAAEIDALATATREERAQAALVRQRILSALSELRAIGADPAQEEQIHLILRRKIDLPLLDRTLEDLSNLLRQLRPMPSPEVPADNLTAKATRNVAHCQESENRSPIDKTEGMRVEVPARYDNFSLGRIAGVCREAMMWLSEDGALPGWAQVLRRANMLAAWIGLHPRQYELAVEALGQERAATTLLCIVQMGERILRPAAYFVSVTKGKRAARFDVERLLRRLGSEQACPA